jgi:hypothetical protein
MKFIDVRTSTVFSMLYLLAASLPAVAQGVLDAGSAAGEEEASSAGLKLNLDDHVSGNLHAAMFWGTGLAIVAIVFLYLSVRERGRLELAKALVEHGKELPPQLLESSRRPRSDLRRGVVFLAMGMGLGACMLLSGHRSIWSISLVPGLIGIGYLVVWMLERPATRPSDPERR